MCKPENPVELRVELFLLRDSNPGPTKGLTPSPPNSNYTTNKQGVLKHVSTRLKYIDGGLYK